MLRGLLLSSTARPSMLRLLTKPFELQLQLLYHILSSEHLLYRLALDSAASRILLLLELLLLRLR